MRVKRAGIATKLLVLVLLAVLAAGLLSTQAKLTEARSARDELARQVEEQREANAALADIARSRLGLLEPDEIEFVDSSK